MPAVEKERRFELLPFLQLGRVPNTFTAVADVLMGGLFVPSMARPWPMFACLVMASCLLYTAGMVLNDVYDLDLDRRERPNRPLPSGKIDWRWARNTGWALLGLGVVSASLYSWVCGLVALALAVMIWYYDRYAKRSWMGPLAMGSCRFLNIIMGMSCAIPSPQGLAGLLFSIDHWMIAAGIGVYVMGITLFAKHEAERSPRRGLAVGLGVMVIGISLLAAFPRTSAWSVSANSLEGVVTSEFRPLSIRTMHVRPDLWPWVLGLLMLPLVRRSLRALVQPGPKHVQMVIKLAIFSLIVLDAAVVMAVRGPWPALGILGLLAPMLLLGKWVYST